MVSTDDVSVDKLDVCDVVVVDVSSVVIGLVLEKVVAISVGGLDIKMSVLLSADMGVVCMWVVASMINKKQCQLYM